MGVSYLLGTQVEEPTNDIVSLSVAKSYARIGTDEDDAIVELLVKSALREFESFTQSLLFQREVTATYAVPDGDTTIRLPFAPIVEVLDTEGVSYTQEGELLRLTTSRGALQVTYRAGWVESTVPSDIQEGALKYIASNYDDRQDLAEGGVQMMPNGSRSKWARYKNMRI